MTGSPSGFESADGNLVLTNTDGTHTDWNCFVGSTGFQTGTPNSNCFTHSGATAVVADQQTSPSTGELQWKSGQKFDTACPAFNTGNNPPKDEWTNIAEYSDTNSTSHDTFFYGAAIRSTVNGNSSGDVEFRQDATSSCRSAGDKMIAFDFLNGGTTLNFHTLTWVTSGGTCYVSQDSAPCWEGGDLVGSGVGDGASNAGTNGLTGAISGSNNGISGTALAVNQFSEFGINLTQALGLSGCINFPEQIWESRSSGSSFTSNPEDIEIVSRHINTCGSITIVKHTDPRGLNQQFGYSGTGSGVASSFALNDSGNTSGDSPCAATATSGSTTTSPCNSITFGNLNPGSYSVTENAEPSGYTSESVHCKNNTVADDSVVSGVAADISLNPGDNWVCTYQNQAEGEIEIVKHTDPRGIDQVFTYSSGSGGANGLGTDSTAGGVACTSGGASGVSSGAFCLNDSGNSTGDDTANTLDVKSLAPGTYNVTETLPGGWSIEHLACTADTSSGSSGSQDSTTSTQADITLDAGGLVTCTYQNKAPSGAILVTKTGKDKACVSDSTSIGNGVCTGAATAKLGGAVFKVTTDSAGTSAVSGSPITTSNSTGTACIDGLFWNGSGNTYYVTETGAPGGYSVDNSSAVAVVVSANATCNSSHTALASGTSGVVFGTSSAPSFTDSPLTNLTVTATAQTAGATQSTITCSSTDGTFVSPFATAGPSDPASAGVNGANGLKPGTYYCKVYIDP